MHNIYFCSAGFGQVNCEGVVEPVVEGKPNIAGVGFCSDEPLAPELAAPPNTLLLAPNGDGAALGVEVAPNTDFPLAAAEANELEVGPVKPNENFGWDGAVELDAASVDVDSPVAAVGGVTEKADFGAALASAFDGCPNTGASIGLWSKAKVDFGGAPAGVVVAAAPNMFVEGVPAGVVVPNTDPEDGVPRGVVVPKADEPVAGVTAPKRELDDGVPAGVVVPNTEPVAGVPAGVVVALPNTEPVELFGGVVGKLLGAKADLGAVVVPLAAAGAPNTDEVPVPPKTLVVP